MIYILQLETATKNCSVALSKNGKTIFYKEIAEEGYSHAENLHIFIEEILQLAQIKFQELSAVAVSSGPGSYTGLRIGVSAAKGFCYTLNIPLIAIETLQILAQQVIQNDDIIIPMIDARRMEVYSAVFDSNKNKIRATQAEIITENSFSEFQEKIYFVGDCTHKLKTVLIDDRFHFLEYIIYPSAKNMSEIAYQKFVNTNFENVAYFEPFYLKEFMLTK